MDLHLDLLVGVALRALGIGGALIVALGLVGLAVRHIALGGVDLAPAEVDDSCDAAALPEAPVRRPRRVPSLRPRRSGRRAA